MEITYSVILYIYLGLVALFIIFSFFDLYHVVRFGFLNSTTVGMTFVFIAGSAILLFISYTYLRDIDWSQKIIIELPVSFSAG